MSASPDRTKKRTALGRIKRELRETPLCARETDPPGGPGPRSHDARTS